jgi:ankyrin repeat protein
MFLASDSTNTVRLWWALGTRRHLRRWLLMSKAATAELLKSAAAGDLERLKELVLEGRDVDRPDDSGTVALHWAVSKQHPDVTAWLLGQGANPNARNSYGYSPLHYTALYGFTALAHLLLEAGARVDLHLTAWHSFDDQPKTALGMAMHKHRECAEVLLSAGADLNLVARPWAPWVGEYMEELRRNCAKVAFLRVISRVGSRKTH